MRLDGQKELTPVVYGDSAVKIHDSVFRSGAQLRFTTHWHERMEILVILNGGLEIYSGDIKEYAKAGSVAVFMPGQPHRGTPRSSCPTRGEGAAGGAPPAYALISPLGWGTIQKKTSEREGGGLCPPSL